MTWFCLSGAGLYAGSMFDILVDTEEQTPHAEARKVLLEDVAASWELGSQAFSGTAMSSREDDGYLSSQLEAIVIPKMSIHKMPLSRAIDMLSELSQQWDEVSHQGVNIVLIDPDKKDPLVSLTLRKTTLKKALDYLTQSVGYTYDLEDEAVIVSPSEAEARHLLTEFFPVSRATVLRLTGLPWAQQDKHKDEAGAKGLNIAKEEMLLRQFLEKAGVNFDSTPGSNFAFEGTQLIVTQTPRNLKRVKNILNRFNEIKQVEIEAKFLEVQEGALEELGVRWEATRKKSKLQSKDTLRTLSDSYSNKSFSVPSDPLITGDTQPIAVNNLPPDIPNAINLAKDSTNLASITGVLGEVQVTALLRALEQQGSADLMSAPKLTVLSSKTAKIIVAQELRYPESYGNISSDVGANTRRGGGSAGVAITAGTPRDFKTRNIGVEMEVTPTVEEDNSITLRLEPQVTEFEGFVEYGGSSIAVTETKSVTVNSGFFQPIFSTRQIHTEVTVFNGSTVVMGGLTREEVKKTQDKVPILGDIPLLGRLFRSRGETSQKRNLLILVTARLVTPDGRPIQVNEEVVVMKEPVYVSAE